jgi:hypothetical protein
VSDRHPYVGPVALGENDQIYGRDWERAELRDLLLARGVVLMHSPSGAGKTSLVHAGVIPLLRARKIEILPSTRPGLPLGRVLPRQSQNRYSASMLAQLDDRLTANELATLTLEEYFHRQQESPRRLLIVDQFEEILTLDPTDFTAKSDFFRDLGRAMRALDGLVLFCIREDYVGALEPYLNHLPTRLATRFRLDLLDKRAAMEAIQRPALEAGVRIENSAARHIWNSLCQVLVRRPDGVVESTAGPHLEAVQLQVVCKQVWDAPRKHPLRITKADVERLGRIDDALGRFYAESIEHAARAGGASERHLRQWFGDRLITHGLRGQVMEGSEAIEGVPEQAIQHLVNAHVLREELRRGIRWFEVAHDRLIEPIVRNNRRWSDEHMTTLARLTERWYQSHQSADLLLTLDELARFKPESPREQEFMRASEQARHAERRTNLAITGWGVVFAADADPAIRDALEPLLALRRSAAGERYRQYEGQSGYQAGETAEMFVFRQGATPGLSDFSRVPYYLLIVGGPDTIPFEFQYSLSANHAVGRIEFDTAADYDVYARSVAFCQTGNVALPRALCVFAPSHKNDPATRASTHAVAYPMVERFHQSHPDWEIQTAIGPEATKTRLAAAISGDDAALALCVLAHGADFKKDDARQLTVQGAPVCHDFVPDKRGLQPEYYYAAADVGDDARLIGTIAFLVASSSAGTPKHDEFTTEQPPRELASKPFIAALPKRMLSHPNGSALAVVGHVERNWLYSLSLDGKRPAGLVESVLTSLLNGHTVGSAMTALTQRASFLYFELAEAYRTRARDVPDSELQRKLVMTIDVRNFVILGDPAVRLPISAPGGYGARPVLPEARRPAAADQAVPADQDQIAMILFNGINGRTGELVVPPLTAREVATILRAGELDGELRATLRRSFTPAL